MALGRAEAAPAVLVLQLGVKNICPALDLQSASVRMKIDGVAASASGLSADQAIAAHERHRCMAVGGEADLTAAARTVERHGHVVSC